MSNGKYNSKVLKKDIPFYSDNSPEIEDIYQKGIDELLSSCKELKCNARSKPNYDEIDLILEGIRFPGGKYIQCENFLHKYS